MDLPPSGTRRIGYCLAGNNQRDLGPARVQTLFLEQFAKKLHAARRHGDDTAHSTFTKRAHLIRGKIHPRLSDIDVERLDIISMESER